MCAISSKMWKKSLCIWELNRIKYALRGKGLCTIPTSSSNQEDDKSLTKEKARTLVMNMTTEERDNLAWCLNHLESEETKAEYRGSVLT